MTHIIAVASQKGGCGKTTTALNLALALAEAGHRTLLCELDPQGALAHSLRQGEHEHAGLAEVLTGALRADEVIIQTKNHNLALLGRGRLDAIDAAAFEDSVQGGLAEVLDKVSSDFEYVLLDTPSGLGRATRAALNSAGYVLIPLQAEPLALRSIEQVLRVVAHVKTEANPELVLLGILPTMVSRRDEPSMNALIAAWKNLGGVFETTIPREAVFAKASEAGVPLSYLGGTLPPEAKRFGLLASEVAARIDELKGNQGGGDERAERRLL